MDVKKLALLIGALVIAVVTAVMAKNMFAGAGAQQAAAAPAVPLGPKVLVARKALPVGTIIDAESFTYQPRPKELLQAADYVEGSPDSDPKQLLGTVVRYPITAGQPVTRGSLVGPQDRGFLAAALGPGMRAITVPVNTSGGVAGFVCGPLIGREDSDIADNGLGNLEGRTVAAAGDLLSQHQIDVVAGEDKARDSAGRVHGNGDGAHARAKRGGEKAAILRAHQGTASNRLAS